MGASNPAFATSRKWGPGSDIFCPDERMILAQVNSTHDLALNLFCVDRPQLLLLTLDSYKRQHQALDKDDFTVMLTMLTTFPSMYAIYNCGERGGCSRIHKHIQGLRGPPHAFDHLINHHNSNSDSSSNDDNDDAAAAAATATTSSKLPFKAFSHHFPQTFANTSPSQVLAVYTSLLAHCEALLDTSNEDAAPPHNVVLWRDWLIVVPRRKGNFQGASANAGGMLGSVWVPSSQYVQQWMHVPGGGCARVLAELGVPVE